ncbi:hypothetical protein OG417_52270 [Actinoallomurus sp. NBC_01490]|uniref:hypothetical protein n=1 Tax=Actinoallomurus sp. NBC_01490 TaxID=2903557 RepID=UPI002E32D79A|nr:hypothetical protein [Actinoallomurus sp. NBC_01490]
MNSGLSLVIAIPVGSAVFAGAVTYAVTDRNLKMRTRVAASLLSAFLVGATSLFVLYLSVFAFLVTMVGYLVMRRLFKPGLALAGSAVVLCGGLSFAVMLMVAALDRM